MLAASSASNVEDATAAPPSPGHKYRSSLRELLGCRRYSDVEMGESERIAWESHQLAETDVYGALGIPERPCMLDSCDPAMRRPITLSSAYMEHEVSIP
jgi:hypothetical protein